MANLFLFLVFCESEGDPKCLNDTLDTLAVSSDEREDVSDISDTGVSVSLEAMMSHTTFRTHLSAGNSSMLRRLQRALPKSGSSNCKEKCPCSPSFSLRISFSWSTDSGGPGSLTRRKLSGEMHTCEKKHKTRFSLCNVMPSILYVL